MKSGLSNKPSEIELKIYHVLKREFEANLSTNNDIYKKFAKCLDPKERESLARKIQQIEEAIVHRTAREFGLTFKEMAAIYHKVEVFLG